MAHGLLVFIVRKFNLKLILTFIGNNGSTFNIFMIFNGNEVHSNCVYFSYPFYPGLRVPARDIIYALNVMSEVTYSVIML